MKKTKEQKGITLISLVITIILLLILATVAINLAVDSDGLFRKAGTAANSWNASVDAEGTKLENLMLMANSVGGTAGGGNQQITFTLNNVEFTTTKGTRWMDWLKTVDKDELTNLWGELSSTIYIFNDGVNWGECTEDTPLWFSFGPPVGTVSISHRNEDGLYEYAYAGHEIISGGVYVEY